jgi:hypothetical protein
MVSTEDGGLYAETVVAFFVSSANMKKKDRGKSRYGTNF